MPGTGAGNMSTTELWGYVWAAQQSLCEMCGLGASQGT